MSTSNELTGMDEFAALIANVLIGGYFTVSGANDLIDLSGTIEEVASVGIPAAGLAVLLVSLAKFILGILLIIKLQTKVAAFTLVWYELITMFLFYGPMKWDEHPQTEVMFYTNFALLSALLLIYAYSRGNQYRM